MIKKNAANGREYYVPKYLPFSTVAPQNQTSTTQHFFPSLSLKKKKKTLNIPIFFFFHGEFQMDIRYPERRGENGGHAL